MRLGGLIGVTGLILDIIGAWYISRGLVKKTLREINQEAPGGISAAINDAYVIGASTQKIEAKTGFCLLALGFSFQAVTYLSIELLSINLPLWWFILDIVALAFVNKILGRFVNRKVKNIKKEHFRKIIRDRQTKEPLHKATTKYYLKHLGVNFEEDICTEDAWQKLLKELEIYY